MKVRIPSLEEARLPKSPSPKLCNAIRFLLRVTADIGDQHIVRIRSLGVSLCS